MHGYPTFQALNARRDYHDDIAKAYMVQRLRLITPPTIRPTRSLAIVARSRNVEPTASLSRPADLVS
jgi:hypothetical protein